MKKVGLLLLALCLLLGMSGCGGTGTPAQTNNENQPNNENQQNDVQESVPADEPTEIVLTVENIAEYLTINRDVHDIVDTSNSAGEQREGKITMTTSPKKRGDFNNVVLQVKMVTSSAGWKNLCDWDPVELVIPFDGKCEQTFKIWGWEFHSSYMSNSPSITLEIVSVSGTFVEP